MDVRMRHYPRSPRLVLSSCGQLAMDKKERNFKKGALLCKLFNRISSVAEDALFAIYVLLSSIYVARRHPVTNG